MRKGKGKYNCPQNLQEYIEIVNLLTEELVEDIQAVLSKEASDVYDKLWELKLSEPEKYKDWESDWVESEIGKIGDEFKETIKRIIKYEVIKEFLFQGFNRSDYESWSRPSYRFSELIKAKGFFRNIARQENKIKLFGQNFPIHFEVVKFESTLIIDESGFLKPRPSEFLSIFQVEDINYEKIRICEVCSKIFWAKRVKSKTCSRTCLNNLINQNYRKEHREKINKARRTTYKSKKEQKEGKNRRKFN